MIAIDGKTLRGARRHDDRQLHLPSALGASTGIILAQVDVAVKSNEIRASTRRTWSNESWAAWTI